MNYYAARQRQSNKRWDYTVRNDEYIAPVGYCSKYYEWTEELFKRLGIPENDPNIERARSFKHKHHDIGHSTEKEACECYREYLLDQKLKLMLEKSDVQHKCVVCGEWTTNYAEVDTKYFDLCKDHNNREEVEKLFGVPGEIWKS
jgi:hypothetical protein